MALCRRCCWSVWGVLVALAVLWSGAAQAESWCAETIFAHEWGVMVFNGRGEAETGLVTLPSWIEQRARAGVSAANPKTAPVRELPPDGGDRDLPVLHFYAPRLWSATAPVGVEVGFKQGVASAWFPRVDGLRSAVEANSPGAQAARERLVKARTARDPFGASPPPPSDPTRQLIWEALSLSPTSPASLHAPEQPWVESLRAIPDALWVSGATQSERFIFYEGRTSEKPALSLAASAPSRCACGVENTGAHAVFDVLVVARAPSGEVRVGWAARVEAGKSMSISLGDALDPKAFEAATRGQLLAALTAPTPSDGDDGTPPASGAGCVMGRDPALPTEASSGHTLYEAEAKALVSIWGAHLFDQPGLTVLYRESPAHLDAVMPLSLYTDMFHHITLNRVGLVAQRDLPLSACACTP